MNNLNTKKSSIVFNSIINDLKTGKLKSRDTLPSEKELCKIHSLGKGSVREALNALELAGIIRRQAGNKTEIQNLNIGSIFNPVGLHFDVDYKNLIQVIEFREVLEEIVLKILIKKISEEDLKNLNEILELSKFYCNNDNSEKYVEYDYKFHRCLAFATKNIIIQNLFDIIYPFLKIIIETTAKIQHKLKLSLKDHLEIFDSVKSKDIKKGSEIIARHMNFTKAQLEKIYNVNTKNNLL